MNEIQSINFALKNEIVWVDCNAFSEALELYLYFLDTSIIKKLS